MYKNNRPYTAVTAETVLKGQNKDGIYRDNIEISDDMIFREANMSEEDKEIFNRLYPKTNEDETLKPTETPEEDSTEKPKLPVFKDELGIASLMIERGRTRKGVKKNRQKKNTPTTLAELKAEDLTEEMKSILLRETGALTIEDAITQYNSLSQEEKDKIKKCL